jgi:cytochrome c2
MADVIAFLYYLRFNEVGGNAREGATVFARKGCASCHALDGRPAPGPDLKHSRAAGTPLGLATAMWNHAPAMFDLAGSRQVEWPRFELDEMRDLSAFLGTLRAPARRTELAAKPVPSGSDRAAVPPELVQEGKALTARYGCAACHVLGASATGKLGPDLNTVFSRRSPDYVLKKLAEPRFDNEKSLMPKLALTDEQQRAILEYLRTVGP